MVLVLSAVPAGAGHRTGAHVHPLGWAAAAVRPSCAAAVAAPLRWHVLALRCQLLALTPVRCGLVCGQHLLELLHLQAGSKFFRFFLERCRVWPGYGRPPVAAAAKLAPAC